MDTNKAIPLNRSVEGWKNVIIKENNEPLVLLNNYSPESIIVRPRYYLQNIPHSSSNCYARKSVAELLLKAAENLPGGCKFLIWDAWRPLEVQHALFEAFKANLESKTSLTGEELLLEVQKYVSLPSADEHKPSPHVTGGAVDLTITDNKGNELNMGTDFDYFGDEAETVFYELKPNVSVIDNFALKNRRILYNLLVDVGFTNYPHEWWHFDFGNQFWGKLSGKDAFYNKTRPPQS